MWGQQEVRWERQPESDCAGGDLIWQVKGTVKGS